MKTPLRTVALLGAAILAGLATLGALLARFLPGGSLWALTIARAGTEFQAVMVSNWATFAFGQALVAASGVLPASMIAIIAGVTYGFGWGLAISVAATMLGGWIAFALSRSVLRRFIERWLARSTALQRFDSAVGQESWRFVLLLRVSPVMPFALTSYGLGLTRIGQRDFLLGTLASLPALCGYVAMGALGRAGFDLASGPSSPWRLGLVAAGIATVVYALVRVRAVLQRMAEPATAQG